MVGFVVFWAIGYFQGKDTEKGRWNEDLKVMNDTIRALESVRDEWKAGETAHLESRYN